MRNWEKWIRKFTFLKCEKKKLILIATRNHFILDNLFLVLFRTQIKVVVYFQVEIMRNSFFAEFAKPPFDTTMYLSIIHMVDDKVVRL